MAHFCLVLYTEAVGKLSMVLEESDVDLESDLETKNKRKRRKAKDGEDGNSSSNDETRQQLKKASPKVPEPPGFKLTLGEFCCHYVKAEFGNFLIVIYICIVKDDISSRGSPNRTKVTSPDNDNAVVAYPQSLPNPPIDVNARDGEVISASVGQETSSSIQGSLSGDVKGYFYYTMDLISKVSL